MASRSPTPKKPARPKSGTKRKTGASGEGAAPRLAYEPLPSVADLKRARAKLEAALAALERKRRK